MTHWQSGMRLTPARLGENEENTFDVTFSNTSQVTHTVTFAAPFAATPRVTAQVVSGSGSAVRATVLVLSRSTTQAQFRVDLAASVVGPLNVTVDWKAKR